VYTPVAGFFGTDTFRYEADVAGQSQSGVAAISIFSTAESITLDHLRNIGLAVLNYESVFKRYPAGSSSAAYYDANGNPLLSWRVYVLPYLGYQSLYNQFHFDEPWDSPNNLPLAAQMPDVFRNVGDSANSNTTRFQIISGDGAPYYWRRSNGLLLGPTGANFTDGQSNSFLAVETGGDKAIVWTKPDPIDFDPSNPLASLGTISSKTIHAVTADGSTISLLSSIDPSVFKSLVTISGGEVVDAGTLRREYAEANGGDAAVQAFGTLQTDSNLRNIDLALLNYNDTVRRFPVGSSAQYDPTATPYLSWRVYILPYIGQKNLYNKFNLTEPWDSPTNLPLLAQMPDVFRSAGDGFDSTVTRIMSLASTKTGFVVFNTGGTQTGISTASVSDGTSNTIMFVEAGHDQAVPWTKPVDLPFDINNSLAALGDLSAGSFKAAFFDGHVSTLPSDVDAATFSALATRGNREVLDAATVEAHEARRIGRTSYGSEVNNFKQIVLAMLNFQSARTRYPASSVDATGKPLLSWRVAILPFIEQSLLYDQFNKSEPWDSPHNLALLDQMPSVFRMPGDPWDSTTTRLQTFNGIGAVYPTPAVGTSLGPKPSDITDGTSRTIAITETGSGNAVPWTKPTDEPFWLNDPFSPLGDLGVNFVTSMFDGSVQTRSSSISMSLLKALITGKGGEDTTNPPPITNVPGFFVYQTAGDTVTNEFGADSFDVVLDKAPGTNVVLSLAISNTAVAILDKPSLTFTSTNWNIPQRVVFRGVDNHVLSNDQSVDITVAVNGPLSDDAYDAVAAQVFTATVRDDDLKQGDFDRNDIVEQADYNVWRSNFGATSGAGLAADANHDGTVDGGDYVLWRKNVPSSAPQVSGDYDLNGVVQQADFNVWRANFAASGTGLAADGNHNGQVDAADYVLWRKAVGSASGSGAVAETLVKSNMRQVAETALAADATVETTAATDDAFAWLAAALLQVENSQTIDKSAIESSAARAVARPELHDLLLANLDLQGLARERPAQHAVGRRSDRRSHGSDFDHDIWRTSALNRLEDGTPVESCDNNPLKPV
jgi:hypothetical protein